MEIIKKFIDDDSDPDVTGHNVEVLYSDSARLQMRMVTPYMAQFTSAQEQRREFPQGIHVWFYEKTGELKAEIVADWARHDMEKELWEARGNVVLTNAEGRKLETEQMFWNEKKGEVFSEKYTKITEKNGNIYSGDSFWTKQDFKEYKLFNKTGVGRVVFWVEEDESQNDEN